MFRIIKISHPIIIIFLGCSKFNALNSVKSGKTIGNDGLTKEFYVCFFGEVVPLLVNSLNYSFKVGEVSISQ